MQDFNYEEDLRIDPDALDVEWLMQPQLYMRYSVMQAAARDEMDRAKERVDVVRAELDNEVRQNPDKYLGEGTRVTNPAVEAVILLDKDYKKVNDVYYDKRREYELLCNALRALDHRKAALENLVRLHAATYFAGPKEPRDLHVEYTQRAKENLSRGKVRDKMKEHRAEEPERSRRRR